LWICSNLSESLPGRHNRLNRRIDLRGQQTVAAFAKVDASAATTTASLAAVSAEPRNIAAGAKAVNGSSLKLGGGNGGGSAGGGRGGLWGRVTGAAGRVAGPLAGMVPPGLAGAAAAGYALYEAFDLQDAATKILLTGQQPNTADARQKIIDQITAGSQQTGFGPMQVAQATLESERVLAGLPFAERMNLEKNLMPSAGYEARMKGTSVEEAQTALVSLAHMAGVYDPKGVEDTANKFAYASTVTNVPIGRFENSLPYSLPELHGALGMDAGSVMLLTAMPQNAGILNTKSGTWIRSMFEGSLPAEGTTAHDRSKNTALQRMGLADDNNKSTWMVAGADGKTDWSASLLKFSEAMNHFTTTVTDPAQRIGLEKAAFGERGMSEAQIVAGDNFLKQLPQYQLQMDRFKGGAGGIADLEATSPMAQFYKTLADSEVALAALGAVALPAAVLALRGFDAAVNAITDMISHKAYIGLDGKPEYLDSLNSGGAQAATLPTGLALRAALLNRPGALANGGGPGDSFKGTVALPPPNVTANISAPLSGPAHVTTGPISLTVSGQSIVAALASEITAKIEGLFRGMGAAGTNSDSGHDGRSSPVYPDHMHGAHSRLAYIL
jgi:hypothetical protein